MHRLPLWFAAAFAALAVASGYAAGARAQNFTQNDAFEIETLIYMGKPEDAVKKAEDGLASLRPTDDLEKLSLIAEILTYLCEARAALGQYQQALAACQEANATVQAVEQRQPGAGWFRERAVTELAFTYAAMGEFAPAVALWQGELKRLPDDPAAHPRRIRMLTIIAGLQVSLRQFPEAEATYRRAVALWPKVLKTDRSQAILPHAGLARLYRLQERFKEAEAVLRDGLAAAAEAVAGMSGAERSWDFNEITLSESLGWILYDQGRLDAAHETAEKALNALQRRGSGNDWSASGTKTLLARIEDAEKPGSPEAERLLGEALAAPIENDSPVTLLFHAIAQSELAHHRLLTGDYTGAESLAREAAGTLFTGNVTIDLEAARARVVLARALRGQGKTREAIAFAQEAYAAEQSSLPPYHSETGETLALLRELYAALGQDENRRATETLIAAYKAERAKFESGP